MKIIHFCESITGGIATYLNELIPEQIKKYGSENVRVVISETQKKDLSIDKDILITFGNINRNSFISQLRMLKTYIKSIKTFNPEVIHLHSTFAGFWFRLYLLLTFNRKFKVLYCSHGWAFDRETTKINVSIAKFVEIVLQSVTKKIICISDNDRVTAQENGLNKSKLITIKNAVRNIDISSVEERILNRDKVNFLFLGRFDKQKGFDLLVEAVRLCSGNDFRLYCIGDNVVSKNNVDILKDDRIFLLGWKSKKDVISYMKACDALLMPSRWEGFGLVAIESLLAGCPVFHSGVGGLKEHYRNCSFYQTLDKPIDLALLHLLNNSGNMNLKKIKADLKNEYTNEYTVEQLAIELDKAYRS